MKTVGYSNKMIATIVAACGAQLVALVVQVIATGAFDRVEVAQLVGVALTAVLGFAGGYSAQPDEVVVDAIPEGSVPRS